MDQLTPTYKHIHDNHTQNENNYGFTKVYII